MVSGPAEMERVRSQALARGLSLKILDCLQQVRYSAWYGGRQVVS